MPEGVLAQAGQLSTLTGSVDQLNAGMQGLNSAIGNCTAIWQH